MKVSIETRDYLQAMEGRWVTIRQIGDAKNIGPTAARLAVKRLIAAGYVDDRRVVTSEVSRLYEYRLNEAGQELLKSLEGKTLFSFKGGGKRPMSTRPKKEVLVPAAKRMGTNPWDWQNYKTSINWIDNVRYVPTDAASKYYVGFSF